MTYTRGGLFLLEQCSWRIYGENLPLPTTLTSDMPTFRRAVFHDQTVYPDPHAFKPDRFIDGDGQLDPSVPDPEQRVFGSGRRLASILSTENPRFLIETR